MALNNEDFARSIAYLAAKSRISGAEGRPLRLTILLNPYAGGWTIRARRKETEQALSNALHAASGLPSRAQAARPSETAECNGERGYGGTAGLIALPRLGDAQNAARALVAEIERENDDFHLIVIAGGDGTSRAVLDVLFDAPPAVRSRAAVLRLPLGTGNDGADARTMDEALRLLTRPSHTALQPAVLLKTARRARPYRAFNILSVGLDAFVTRMTNKMKDKLPGDSYKLWVNLAALFYDRVFPVGAMDVVVEDFDGARTAWTERELLLALGASGRRTYGGGKRILPDERNLCAVREMPLLRKLVVKDAFTDGSHAFLPETRLHAARRVEIRCAKKIPAQMDGESVILFPADFPAVLELTEPAIPAFAR
jgi:diacylglycerol kinase family enzyme